MKGRKEREQAATAAWRIVDEAVAGFEKQSDVRLAAPTLAALKARFDGEREQVLAENPGIDAAEATRRLINRLLHQPLAALRQAAPDPSLEEAVRRLFGIDDKKN
jgi:glutamyl-tRNA reductase